MRPVWADVDLGAVAANVAALRAVAAPAQLCAVVKADAYGHGAVPVARAALAGGADLLAVALVGEGIQLRDAGVDHRVLVLSQAAPHELEDLVRHGLEATVYTAAGVADLGAAGQERDPAGPPVRVHLKIDTGMHRVGAQPREALALTQAVIDHPRLQLASVFTHLAVADEPSDPFTNEQLRRFHTAVDGLIEAGVEVPVRHAANTAATIAHPAARLDMVRCGIGIYGLAPAPALAGAVDLVPALSLKARVSHVKRVEAGAGLSYGLRYRPESAATVATVPLGYADGVPRALGARGGQVLIRGRRHAIAGTVTMDQILIDCGDVPVAVGDEVVLIGRQGDGFIPADEWAEMLDTINYEVVCGLSSRVPRRYPEVSP